MPVTLNPFEPAAPINPAMPADATWNPLPSSPTLDAAALLFLGGLALLLFWGHGDKAKRKTSWEE